MARAIQIRYLAATNSKGYRYKAFTACNSLTIERPSNMDDMDFVRQLVEKFMLKFGWEVPHNIPLALLPCGDWVTTWGH